MPAFTLPDGARLYYTEQGPQGGVPVLFLHGYACTGRDWESVVAAVARQYRAFTLDLRGHDRAGRHDGDFTLGTLADDVNAFAHGLGLERPVLVGHSMGGMVALEYALQRPAAVRALVMAEAYPHLQSIVDVFGGAEDPVNDPYGYGSVFDHQTGPAVVARVRAQMGAGVARLPATLFQSLLDFDARARLAELRIPVLWLIGGRRTFHEQDVPLLVQRLGYAAAPQLEARVLDSHHFLMLERPDEVATLLMRYLDRVTAASQAG